jgi:hypothetical protein
VQCKRQVSLSLESAGGIQMEINFASCCRDKRPFLQNFLKILTIVGDDFLLLLIPSPSNARYTIEIYFHFHNQGIFFALFGLMRFPFTVFESLNCHFDFTTNGGIIIASLSHSLLIRLPREVQHLE